MTCAYEVKCSNSEGLLMIQVMDMLSIRNTSSLVWQHDERPSQGFAQA